MKRELLVFLLLTITGTINSIPDEVDDFNRLSSSLTQQFASGLSQHNSDTDIKITDEKHIKKVEIKSQSSNYTPFTSQFLHQGNNLFFKPQILLGSNVNNPPITNKPEIPEIEEIKVDPVVPELEANKDDISSNQQPEILADIPDAPTLAPLDMPKLPEIVIVDDDIKNPPCKQPIPVEEVITGKEPVVLPEPPKFVPLIPPKVILAKPIPYVSNCVLDSNTYGFTVPCPPLVAPSSEIINVKDVTVEKTILSPEILPLRLPKIPIGVIYNKPVKTIIPLAEGVVTTTRFLPSVKVTKFPLNMVHQNVVEIRSSPNILIEKIRRKHVSVIKEEIPVSSFSAYCAHNIALERVLPNIGEGKPTIKITPVSPLIEIPLPVY